MEIGVVAYELEGERTGVGRYLEGLLTGLAELGDDDRYRLFFKGDPFDHPLWSEGSGRFEPVFDRRPDSRPILWEQLRLPRLLRGAGLDLLYSPAYSLPPAGSLPSVVTVHDLSFERLPEEFPWKERWRRRLLARRAVRRARRVLADTSAVARELAERYRVDRSRIGVVPLAVDPRFRDRRGGGPEEDADLALLADHGVRTPYLLYLGSILDRRRLDLVIAAFAAVAASDPELGLVIAGANRLRRPEALGRWIDESGHGGRIVRLGYVPEALLLPLYRRATLSFYLSSYEGYGLPPLESLAAGTPPVVTPGLALDELWPDYPFRCQRLAPEVVGAVTAVAVADPDARRAVAARGAEVLAPLTWRRSAELFRGELREALEL